jgi:hypothetical protein
LPLLLLSLLSLLLFLLPPLLLLALVQDEIAKLDADIALRHAKELQELDAASAAAAASAGGAASRQQAAAAADGSAAVADRASKYLVDAPQEDGDEEEAGGKGKVRHSVMHLAGHCAG